MTLALWPAWLGKRRVQAGSPQVRRAPGPRRLAGRTRLLVDVSGTATVAGRSEDLVAFSVRHTAATAGTARTSLRVRVDGRGRIAADPPVDVLIALDLI